MAQIEILNGMGHLTLEWDHENADEVVRVRGEVENLKRAGYSFFLAEGGPADEVAAGGGKLLVRRLEDPVSELGDLAARHGAAREDGTEASIEVPATTPAGERTTTPPAPPPDGDDDKTPSRRRGRPPREAPAASAVAVRPMRGG